MLDISALATAWKTTREQLDKMKNIDVTEEQIKLKNLILEGLCRENQLKEEIERLRKKIKLVQQKQKLTFQKEKNVYEGQDGNHYCPKCLNQENELIVPLGQRDYDETESWYCSTCSTSYFSMAAQKTRREKHKNSRKTSTIY